jgi:hypothetical protein
MDLSEFFSGHDEAAQLFEAVRLMIDSIGRAEMRVTKSQVAFRRKRGFAWVWMPEMYLKRKAAPLVLSISLRRRDPSPLWKEVVESYPGRFMHHLELYSAEDLDDEIRAVLEEAWGLAGD